MSKKQKRKGTIAIAVLACLAVTTTIVLGAVQSSLRQRRQLQQEIQLEQTRLLLDAGIGKAIAEFKNDQAYTGETLDKIDAVGNYNIAFIEIKKLDSTGDAKFQVIAKLTSSTTKASLKKDFNMMQRSKIVTLQKD